MRWHTCAAGGVAAALIFLALHVLPPVLVGVYARASEDEPEALGAPGRPFVTSSTSETNRKRIRPTFVVNDYEVTHFQNRGADCYIVIHTRKFQQDQPVVSCVR